MKISTKGRYAVIAMLDIAIHEKVGPVTLSDISQCQGISLSYLEQLFSKLRKSKLVKGVRGPGGGYRLALKAEDISIANIIDAVDEKMDMTKCGGQGNCANGKKCKTHHLWFGLSKKLEQFLSGKTLDQYVDRPHLLDLMKKQDAQYGRFLNRKTAA